MPTENLRQRLRTLFDDQRLGVLATVGDRYPHASLVAFAATPDLSVIVFATTRATRKFANLALAPEGALLVDSRANAAADFHAAMAVTAYGPVSETPPNPEREGLLELYLRKHPHLRDFVSAPSCALMRLVVRKYSVVDRFQHVVELEIKA